MRPRDIITAEAYGTHSGYEFSSHQNVKLILVESKLYKLSAECGAEITSYKDCHVSRNPSLPECHCDTVNTVLVNKPEADAYRFV